MKKVAIMQPYFLPYLGYFQLISEADIFVVYDDVKYTKKGWINRNRFLFNGIPEIFTIPLQKASDSLNIGERYLSNDYYKHAIKNLRKIEQSYKKAPYFNETFTILERCFFHEEQNLFNFLLNSLNVICSYLKINTEFIMSSKLKISKKIKCEQRVIEICKQLSAAHYINPIGGLDLYDKENFRQSSINLSFLKMDTVTYKQFNNESRFVPNLSILDIMMFNSPQDIKEILNKYELV